jgi:ubiquinone/menaquinone biosynthesis C-methylase UbiE
MNQDHRIACASPEWGTFLEEVVLPAALTGVDLGDDLLEIGAGPGRTTDLLRTRVRQLTAVELDDDLAAQLIARMAGTNVDVVHADASALPLPDDQFSAAVAFTMLHHVPTAEIQDRIFAELARVVAPGGTVVLSDSVHSDALAGFHADDTYNPVDPATLAARLTTAGLTDVTIDANAERFVAHAVAAP